MKYQIDSVIEVKVSAIEPYGAFVIVDDNYKGLIHISEINGKYIRNIEDYFSVGDLLHAKVLNINEQSKQIKLTLKGVENELKKKNKNLEDTRLGFSLLADLLPEWINEKLDKIEKNK